MGVSMVAIGVVVSLYLPIVINAIEDLCRFTNAVRYAHENAEMAISLIKRKALSFIAPMFGDWLSTFFFSKRFSLSLYLVSSYFSISLVLLREEFISALTRIWPGLFSLGSDNGNIVNFEILHTPQIFPILIFVYREYPLTLDAHLEKMEITPTQWRVWSPKFKCHAAQITYHHHTLILLIILPFCNLTHVALFSSGARSMKSQNNLLFPLISTDVVSLIPIGDMHCAPQIAVSSPYQ